MTENLSSDRRSRFERNEKALNIFVSGSAAVVGVLIILFFLVVFHSAAVVNSQVERVKNGPYPVSVAAGHIETDLVNLETIIEHLVSAEDGNAVHEEDRRDDLVRILDSIEQQVEDIRPILEQNTELYKKFSRELGLLKTRLAVFSAMCWSHGVPASQSQVIAYANSYLYPVINYLLGINNDTLQRTGDDVEEMYSTVNNAISTMFVFAVVMLIGVGVMTCVYLLLMRAKTRFENDLRESLEVALRETREANEAKSAFLSNMSHDIRTPMNAIIGLTVIADENIDDKMRVKQCLTRISTSSQHLLSLINDVLDMNKIESGKVTLSTEEFSISNLISEIDVIMQSQPAIAHLNSEVLIENVRHDIVVGDAMRLRQILLNLTSNAIKYTNEGDDVKLIVRERPQTTPGQANITFIVSDTGIGMKEAFLKRIFEPFERERNDFTIFTEGTGLGMAITKNLVDLMGGTINVESELGMGTTVTIDLSFKIASEESEQRRKLLREAAPAARGSKRSPVKGNVLIVEDNDINMEIAKTLISDRGATVDSAMDGLEAVNKVEGSPDGTYDLIFMDWQMPHMNGIEATKAIRRYLDEHGRTQIPIVAMTANAFTSDRDEALAAGMNDFMAKPINIHELDEALHKYLENAGEAEE